MTSIKKRLENDYLLGCIKRQNCFDIYLMPIAWWILNYKKYDPDYNPRDWEIIFRNHIYNVLDADEDDYFKSIKIYNTSLPQLIKEKKDIPERLFFLFFFIDFDSKIFINGFPEIDVQDYLPHDQWVGKSGAPVTYLPLEIRNIFK